MEEVDKLDETKAKIKQILGVQPAVPDADNSSAPAGIESNAVAKLLALRKRREGGTQETSPVDKEFIIFEAKPVVENGIDRQQWWREQRVELPLLSKVAQEVLGVPCSSAKSERVFSSAGLVRTCFNCPAHSQEYV